jgi:hypothetical protein
MDGFDRPFAPFANEFSSNFVNEAVTCGTDDFVS